MCLPLCPSASQPLREHQGQELGDWTRAVDPSVRAPILVPSSLDGDFVRRFPMQGFFLHVIAAPLFYLISIHLDEDESSR